MNSLGRNIPNKNIEKTFSGDNLYQKKKIKSSMEVCKENNNNINNNNNKNNVPSGHNSSLGHKKNSFQNTGATGTGTTSPRNKEKLIRISEFKIEQSTQNQEQNNRLSANNSKDLINRLKNQTSYLKSSITNKNQINNKNKAINYFQLDEKENTSINKHIKNELSHCHLVKGINILSKHETFEIEQKKCIYVDKNKFNKNSHLLNEKSNNSNANFNSKDYDMLRKIKNLKTFHPSKFNNKKSISIKINKDKDKDNLEKENNKNINMNTQNNDVNNINESLAEKNKNVSKTNFMNKSRDKIKHKDKNSNKAPSKDKKIEKDKDKENNNIQNMNKKANEEKIDEKKKEEIINDKNDENNKKKNTKKEKEKEHEHDIIENKEKDKEKIKEHKELKETNSKIENKEEEKDKDKENSKKNKESFSQNKNNIKEKEKEQDNIIITPIKKNKNILDGLKEDENERDPEEKVIYFDTSNINNIQIPKEYLNIIYYNLLKEENIELNPKPTYSYMKTQKEINEQMRSILVDWIIDVHHKFGFTDETLFMTILIIDRYCSLEQITRIKYQCLGITALMISCKHEEINVPKVDDFIYITDNAYTKDEVFEMENDVLSKLNFSLLYPSPIKFYEYLSLHFNFSKKYHMLGKYLMESFLLDLKYIKYKPSIISCACAYIVMKFFKMSNYRQSYNKKFYLVDENINTIPVGLGIKDCAQDICVFVDNINSSNLLSCQKKYAKEEFESVSTLINNNKS